MPVELLAVFAINKLSNEFFDNRERNCLVRWCTKRTTLFFKVKNILNRD